MAIPIIEELRESLRSTRMHYTTINAPRGVKILEDIIEGFDKRFGDGTHITKFREGHGRQPCGYTQEQVAATLLVPDLNCIPPDQHDQAWALLRGMVIAVIDEVKNSDASTDVNDSIEDVNDFLVTASAAAAVNSLELSSAEIADREIKIWKTRTVPFPKDKNPLDEWRRGVVYLFPWLGVLARRVLAIPATSAAPERLFSTAGNVMTKKRSRLMCDNMEELVYLHEVWPQVREWEAVKKMRLE